MSRARSMPRCHFVSHPIINEADPVLRIGLVDVHSIDTKACSGSVASQIVAVRSRWSFDSQFRGFSFGCWDPNVVHETESFHRSNRDPTRIKLPPLKAMPG